MSITEFKANPKWSTWLEQAESAIMDGQSLTDFLSNCYPANRKIARFAYNLKMISGPTIKFDIWWGQNEPDSDSITARELAQMAFMAGFNACEKL